MDLISRRQAERYNVTVGLGGIADGGDTRSDAAA
jgi:hypothetical protein